MVAEGKLRVPVAAVYPLIAAREALTTRAKRRKRYYSNVPERGRRLHSLIAVSLSDRWQQERILDLYRLRHLPDHIAGPWPDPSPIGVALCGGPT